MAAVQNYLPGDSLLIDKIVYELKSQGIFDQFRKECIADVDTKPAYQNLRQRVEGSVSGFLSKQKWSSDMNKNQVREMLRKNIYESGFLETGVERIVDQVVNPKINSVFLPKVTEVVYKFLGIEKPNSGKKENTKMIFSNDDLLPTDLEAVSPESEKKFDFSNDSQNFDDSKIDEDESPPFEPLEEKPVCIPPEENSVDSHLSGFSGLMSHDSNHSQEDSKPLHMEISNQDSTPSKQSSEGRLSIVMSDDNDTKMEICDDTTQTAKSNKTNESKQKNFDFPPELPSNGPKKPEHKSEDKTKSDRSDKSSKNHDKHKSRHDSRSERKLEEKDKKTEKERRDYKDKHSSRDRGKERKDSRSESTSKSESKSERDSKSHSSSKSEKDKSKSKHSSSNNISSSKDKSKSSSSRKDSSSSKDRSDKERSKSSSSKDKDLKHKDDRGKGDSKSGSSKTDTKSDKHRRDDKHRSDKHSSSSKNKDKDKKDPKKDKKENKDDHFSSKKKSDRRSTDRDSNDGHSGLKSSSSSFDSSISSQTQNKSQESSNSNSNNGSGDSGNSETVEEIVNEDIENQIVTVPQLKLIKPKFASNIHEARRLMKIRKQLSILEKQNLLNLTKLIGQKVIEKNKLKSTENITNKINNKNNHPAIDVDKHKGKDFRNLTIETKPERAKKEVSPQPLSPPLKSAVVSAATWDALEAKLHESINYTTGYEEMDASEDFIEETVRNKDDCLYLNSQSNEKTERYKKFSSKYIETLENHINKGVLKQNPVNKVHPMHNNNYKNNTNKSVKRKFTDLHSDLKNNNNKKFNTHHIEIHDNFSLPLSPAESDNSIDKKSDMSDSSEKSTKKTETEFVERVKKTNRVSASNQRYSSEDLYKPRPMFGGSRRRSGRNMGLD